MPVALPTLPAVSPTGFPFACSGLWRICRIALQDSRFAFHSSRIVTYAQVQRWRHSRTGVFFMNQSVNCCLYGVFEPQCSFQVIPGIICQVVSYTLRQHYVSRYIRNFCKQIRKLLFYMKSMCHSARRCLVGLLWIFVKLAPLPVRLPWSTQHTGGTIAHWIRAGIVRPGHGGLSSMSFPFHHSRVWPSYRIWFRSRCNTWRNWRRAGTTQNRS